MKVYQLLVLVRQRLGDMEKINFSDKELIYCLNNAIDRLSVELINEANPDMTRILKLEGAERKVKPDLFYCLRGQYQLEWRYEDDGTVTMGHSNPNFDDTLEIRYFSKRPHVKDLQDELPFTESELQEKLMYYTMYDVKPSMEKGGTVNDS